MTPEMTNYLIYVGLVLGGYVLKHYGVSIPIVSGLLAALTPKGGAPALPTLPQLPAPPAVPVPIVVPGAHPLLDQVLADAKALLDGMKAQSVALPPLPPLPPVAPMPQVLTPGK